MHRRPRIFIGSSSEAIQFARDIHHVLDELGAEGVGWWRGDVFPAGETTIESLEQVAANVGAGILLATPDDKQVKRGEDVFVARDNITFEAGLLSGRLGRKRAVLVSLGEPRLPSDLAGVTRISLPLPDGFPDAVNHVDFRERLRIKLSPWVESLVRIVVEAPNEAKDSLALEEIVELLPQRNYIRARFEKPIFSAKERIWVAGMGLGGFLAEWKDLLRIKSREGISLRILALHPRREIASLTVQSQTYSMLEWRDRESRGGQKTQNRSRSLEEWVYNENSILKRENRNHRIELRYYCSFPAGAILIADQVLFYSPTLIERENQLNPTLVLREGNRSFERFENHFAQVWEDPELAYPSSDEFLLDKDTDFLTQCFRECRTHYVVPDEAFLNVRRSFVEHARQKLLYNELAPFFRLAAARNSAKEVRFLRKLRGLVPGSSIRLLDLGCGIGRHANSLAADNLSVVGIDISPVEIELAKRESSTHCKFEVADMRSWAGSEAFDMAVCMWSTFNYLSEPEDRKQFFESCFANLKSHGLLVIDVRNPSKHPSAPYERISYCYPFEVKRLATKRMIGDVTEAKYEYQIIDVRTGETVSLTDQEVNRAFDPTGIIADAEPFFTLDRVLGDYDFATAFDSQNSERLILLLRKNQRGARGSKGE
jgi:SAM-dependent methyltransferase